MRLTQNGSAANQQPVLMNLFFLMVAVLCLALARPAFAAGEYFEVTYPPSQLTNELKLGVTYTLWIPHGVKTLRGVIVHQHGCGEGACQGGATSAYDLHWQALAKKWNCALLGPSYHQRESESCALWCDPRNGSAKTFLRALGDFARQANHPELERVPWCLWGHSGGGLWAYFMQTLYPERIVAIWLRSGTAFNREGRGNMPKAEIPNAAYSIPVMLNPGVKEKDDPRFGDLWSDCLAMFHAYRLKDAPIGYAPDPHTSHECGDSRYLAIPFFNACLAGRLPKRPGAPLKPMPTKQAWLAPLHDGGGGEPRLATKFSGKTNEAVWLPNESVARAWTEYIRTGATSDASPPPAPFDLKARALHGAVELTWDAEADFESGLAGFTIERDGVEMAELPQKPVGRFGRPLFQAMSYHDTPEPPLPAMRFTDLAPQPGVKHRYRVIARNTAGLKSPPSSRATAAAAAAATFPLRVSENGRHLVDASGRPFLIVGDSAWSLIAQLREEDIARYLDDRQKRGFNSIIVSLIEHKFATKAPANIDGVRPFLKLADFTQPNPSYFDSAHRAVAAASQRGITVWLCPAYLGWRGGDEGFFEEIKAAGPAALRAYGRFVGERFKDLPNIVWMLGGDYALPVAERWAAIELATGLRDGGAAQIMTAHGGQTSALDTFGDQPWLAVDTVYRYQPDLWRPLRANYLKKPARPFVLIETTYEGEHDARPEQVRRQAWWTMLSGACGQFFGNNPMWHFDGPGLFKSEVSWRQALDSTGSHDIARLGAFFHRQPWHQLVPDLDDKLAVAGRGQGATQVTAANTADRRLALLYIPADGAGARKLTLNLASFPAPVMAHWFNPAEDAAVITHGAPVPNRDQQTLRTPGDNGTGRNDWVLILETR